MTTFILSKEQFVQYNDHFVSAARARALTAGDMLLHNILCNKDIRRGFTPITNSNKLNHGANEWQGFIAARDEIRHLFCWASRLEAYQKKFGLELTPDIKAAIIAVMGA